MHNRVCSLVTAMLYAAGLLLQASAQTVRGVVENQTTGQPVTAGFVVLVDSDSVVQQRALLDGSGRFLFGVDRPGRYALRSQVIGLQSTTSPFFELHAGEVLDYEFAVPALPIRLDALVVEEERVCRSRSETGLTSRALWNEAQKALNAVVWTEQQGLFRHRLERYERVLEPGTLFETDEGHTWTQEGLYRGSPFGSAPADELVEHGYIRDAGDNEWIYHGPDAKVLLSDEFANTHCFSAREARGEQRGLIGLAFEPTEDRDKPDVSGVLWLDEETAELRSVEYRYTDPPWEIEVSDAGGRIEFEQLPTGVWIVNRWWIRMPVIALRPIQTVRLGTQRLDDYYLAGIRETGAWVAEVTTVDREHVAMTASPPPGIDVSTRSDSRTTRPSETDYRKGFRLGLNVNFLNTGSDVAPFGNAPAFQANVGYSTAIGLQLAGAVQFSRHGIADVRHKYTLLEAFAEPRFAFHMLGSKLSPFIGARVGRAWEMVDDRGATFKSTGFALGGVAGSLLRLDDRVWLESGLTIGKIVFADFSATTDRRWEACVFEQGELGSSMPTTVVACSPPEFWDQPQLTPGEGITGTGNLPRITYANTSRTDSWVGLWLGVVFRL